LGISELTNLLVILKGRAVPALFLFPRSKIATQERLPTMITRLWHGWTSKENADKYEALLKSEILPGIHRVQGYRGATLLRRPSGNEVAFITLTYFESLDDVRAFAGEDYERAVILPEARQLLSRFDERSAHYDTVFKLD
jgi:heme-degrading monooxygenase HmoA